MEKVYCITCDNFVRSKDADIDKCFAPENMEKHVEDTWLRVVNINKRLSHPSVLNKNNDCKWYKQIKPSHDHK